MQAVILAGGKGTRLRPYTITLPKPLVPVGDAPILSIVLGQLRRAGVDKVTLAVNHMADLIMSFCRSGERFGLQIEYSVEDSPLGTVAPLKLIKDLPEAFIVMNGDILSDLNYADIYESHLASRNQLTVATCKRDYRVDYGVLNINRRTSEVVGFQEKPCTEVDVSMGVYVFSRSLLERVPSGLTYGFDDLVLDMLRSDIPINAYRFRGYWMDLGRPDDYDRANLDMERDPALRELICAGNCRSHSLT